MTNQLALIDIASGTEADATAGSASSWQLDPATCELGRRGVARARRALHAARTQALAATVSGSDLPAAA